MADKPLQDLLTRLERERLDADRRYNDALTALDRAAHALAEPCPEPRSIDQLREIVLTDRAARAGFDSLLIQFLQRITEYVDTKDRALGGPELREQIVLANERALALARALERLRTTDDGPQAPQRPQTRPSPVAGSLEPVYVGFEDRFRGSQETIRARVADYVPLFQNGVAGDVLDVGCGRGELLSLLKEAGISARGIDSNPEMIALCHERGLEAVQADALTYLESLDDGSLSGLAAIQVVEHLEPAYLTRLLAAAFQKLRRGAPIVLETINPACWMAFFEAYMRDLTHAQPIHPDTLRFLVQSSGFSSVDIQFRSPASDADKLDRVSDASVPSHAPPALREAIAAINAHADKLNARLFSYMDYAVVARRL